MFHGLKLAAALNAVAAAGLALYAIALVVGGGRVDPFPPDHRIALVPVEPPPAPASATRAPSERLRVPPEWQRVEPAPPRWEEGADGRIRLLD